MTDALPVKKPRRASSATSASPAKKAKPVGGEKKALTHAKVGGEKSSKGPALANNPRRRKRAIEPVMATGTRKPAQHAGKMSKAKPSGVDNGSKPADGWIMAAVHKSFGWLNKLRQLTVQGMTASNSTHMPVFNDEKPKEEKKPAIH